MKNGQATKNGQDKAIKAQYAGIDVNTGKINVRTSKGTISLSQEKFVRMAYDGEIAFTSSCDCPLRRLVDDRKDYDREDCERTFRKYDDHYMGCEEMSRAHWLAYRKDLLGAIRYHWYSTDTFAYLELARAKNAKAKVA